MRRRINVRLLMKSTVLYRLFVVAEQYIIFWLFGQIFGIEALTHEVSLLFSIGWNIINMITYYVWHYELFTHFKIGKE
jgi:hypothetical protein